MHETVIFYKQSRNLDIFSVKKEESHFLEIALSQLNF
jgi:hypothetical protein